LPIHVDGCDIEITLTSQLGRDVTLENHASYLRLPAPVQKRISAAFLETIYRETNQRVTMANTRLTDVDEQFKPLRVLDESEAQELILRYVLEHPNCWTDDVSYDLGIDPLQANRILHKLESEGKIHGHNPK
jgi:hypothetical protein